MRRRYYLAAAGLAGLFVAAGSIEFAGTAHSLPLFQHTPHATATAECPAGTQWRAKPVVSVTDPGGPWSPSYNPAPASDGYWYASKNQQTISATVTFHYTDGHADDTRTILIDRPVGCEAPPDAPTTSTTVITWTPPPTLPTTPTSVPMTPIGPPSTTTAPSSLPPTGPGTSSPAASVVGSAAPTTVMPRQSPKATSTTAPTTLPPTGASDWLPLAVAVGGFLLFAGLVLTTARRAHDDDTLAAVVRHDDSKPWPSRNDEDERP